MFARFACGAPFPYDCRALVLFAGFVSAFPVAADAISVASDTGPAEFVRMLGNQALGIIRADRLPLKSRRFFTSCCNRILTFRA